MSKSLDAIKAEKVAFSGCAKAQVDMAYRFVFGYGVEMDLLTAYSWVYVAAQGADATAIELEQVIGRSLITKELAGEGASRGRLLATELSNE